MGRSSEHELVESTLIGRHPRCHIRLEDPRVSMVWIEVRHTERGWAWREFGDTGMTRGTGAALEGGWRLVALGSHTARVTCCDGVHVEFLDAGEPAPMAQDLRTGAYVTGDDFDALFEVHDGLARPVGWDVDLALAEVAVLDHGSLVLGDALYQLFLPSNCANTHRGELDVSHGEVRLEIDLSTLIASLSLGSVEVEIGGEPVRALAVYAMSRQHEHFDDGGWLGRQEAYDRWVELGGKADTPLERIAWERGKLRTALARQGVRHVSALFEVRRQDGTAAVRCSFSPDRIDVH